MWYDVTVMYYDVTEEGGCDRPDQKGPKLLWGTGRN